MAGQFAKPRSSPTEVRGGVELPSFRGDMVNDFAFDELCPTARPDPARPRLPPVRGDDEPAARLRQGRVRRPGARARRGTRSSSRRARRGAATTCSRPRSSARCGSWRRAGSTCRASSPCTRSTSGHAARGAAARVRGGADPPGQHHRRLVRLLGAPALGRGADQRASTARTWSSSPGSRTRWGSSSARAAAPDDVVALCERLNPRRQPGRLVLFSRMGADRVTETLPPLLRAVTMSGHPVLWACDPMHGNTFVHASGYKTRRFDDVLRELRGFFAACEAADVSAGGVHVELTGRRRHRVPRRERGGARRAPRAPVRDDVRSRASTPASPSTWRSRWRPCCAAERSDHPGARGWPTGPGRRRRGGALRSASMGADDPPGQRPERRAPRGALRPVPPRPGVGPRPLARLLRRRPGHQRRPARHPPGRDRRGRDPTGRRARRRAAAGRPGRDRAGGRRTPDPRAVTAHARPDPPGVRRPAPTPPRRPSGPGTNPSCCAARRRGRSTNMEARLGVPTATSVRTVPAKLLEVNRQILNNHLGRTGRGKVSFTHLIVFAVVRGDPGLPRRERQLRRPGTASRGRAPPAREPRPRGRRDPQPTGPARLLVPNIKHADELDFAGFWARLRGPHRQGPRPQARPPTTSPPRPVTITNPGMIGTVHSVPRLMPGQGFIVGVGRDRLPGRVRGRRPRRRSPSSA